MDELVFPIPEADPSDVDPVPCAPVEAVSRPMAMDREIDRLTADARAKAAAVSVAVAELVDAVAALEPHEGRIAVEFHRLLAL